jgi:hypothetical protein
MLSLNFSRHGVRFTLLALITLSALLLSSVAAFAQTTVSQGSIQGSVTDPSGAVVGGAKITISNKATGQVNTTSSSTSGTYNSGGLIPGDYVVRVEASGFKTTELPVVVQVAVTSSGNIHLEVGQGSTVVEVQGASVTVNTEQATVQGVLTADQIDKLPVDGRNFLDLAQLEPGVQIQDGQTFDPTKAGYSSVSINGVFGRTPRIELDGLDISDENVGTTTQNVALSSIQEFNISRSGLDLSTELTSAGSVNVATRSGTNDIHGMAFYNFRDRNALTANFAEDVSGYYQRNNFGGRFGGALIKDKLFYFIDSERQKQDGVVPVSVASFGSGLSGGFTSPFRDTEVTGKLDWNATKEIHVFYRFTYNWNISESNFGYDYSVYSNKDNAPSHALGVDWNRGSWSHSFRAGYLKFHNQIAGATASFDPLPSGEIAVLDTGEVISGPNLLAPQGTLQTNKQFKYDGSKVFKSHIFRFGVGVNRILGGGFASFFGLAPQDLILSNSNVNTAADLLAQPFQLALLGNGQGFFTEKAAFGYPGGGQADTRFQAYVGDSWKIKPNLTLSYGLRYNRDTGRSDSDLAPTSCSTVSASVIAAGFPGCTGNLLDQWGAGLGNRVQNPNHNFGPQVGFAWDPKKDGKTVIRGGAGLYYENYIFNNTLFDRPNKLAQGLFFGLGQLNCTNPTGAGSVSFNYTSTQSVKSIDGVDLATGVCQQPLSVAGPLVADLQTQYQAAVKALGPQSNSNFVGNDLTLNTRVVGPAFDPNFRTARSYQMNIGVQRQLTRGGVFTADYIRNVSLHFQEGVDVNHVGDSRYLDSAAALAAINATAGGAGCAAATTAATAQAAVDCYIAATPGASINDFAGNGLDSGFAVSSHFGLTGSPASVVANATGLPFTTSNFAAFAGINPNLGVGEFNMPIGRSVYNGLQTSYKQQVGNPFRGVTSMDLTISYTLSKFAGTGGSDQNFSPLAFDFRNPTGFNGPTSLDRLHQFKFGATFNVAHRGPQFSVIGNFGSAPPTTLVVTSPGGPQGTGEIFRSDLTGDGTVGDLFPAHGGTVGQPGQFQRSVSASNIGAAINNWNTTQAGNPTPAGQALIDAGFFRLDQLQTLGGVKQILATPPSNEAGNTMYKEVSSVLSWPIKIRERFTVEPSISAFNIFNFANFGRLTGGINSAANGGAGGSVVGTANSHTGAGGVTDLNSVRIGTGSGVFAVGASRQVEFGLKVSF